MYYIGKLILEQNLHEYSAKIEIVPVYFSNRTRRSYLMKKL